MSYVWPPQVTVSVPVVVSSVRVAIVAPAGFLRVNVRTLGGGIAKVPDREKHALPDLLIISRMLPPVALTVVAVTSLTPLL
jgi:hypothetical protein